MCICAYVYMYTHICTHVYIHVCTHMYIRTCVYMHAHVYAHVHTCMHAYMHTCVYAYMCICINMSLGIYMFSTVTHSGKFHILPSEDKGFYFCMIFTTRMYSSNVCWAPLDPVRSRLDDTHGHPLLSSPWTLRLQMAVTANGLLLWTFFFPTF